MHLICWWCLQDEGKPRFNYYTRRMEPYSKTTMAACEIEMGLRVAPLQASALATHNVAHALGCAAPCWYCDQGPCQCRTHTQTCAVLCYAVQPGLVGKVGKMDASSSSDEEGEAGAAPSGTAVETLDLFEDQVCARHPSWPLLDSEVHTAQRLGAWLMVHGRTPACYCVWGLVA